MSALHIALLIGGFVALFSWQIGMFFHQLPRHQRQYLDRPAYGFRLIWPLIRVGVYCLGHRLSDKNRQRTSLKLKQAGVDFSLSAEEFIASKCICALLSGALLCIVLHGAGHWLIFIVPLTVMAGFYYPTVWLRDKSRKRRTSILRALPFYLDIVTLAIESGSNLTGGLTKAVQKTTDTPLRREISRVLRDIRSGKPRADALLELSERADSPAVTQIVTGLIQAEKTGANLGPMLRVQAEQLRNQRFQQAEKKAMEAPVKLLAPLYMFIFPTSFLALAFVLVSKAIQEGFFSWPPLVWAYQWPGVN